MQEEVKCDPEAVGGRRRGLDATGSMPHERKEEKKESELRGGVVLYSTSQPLCTRL